MYFCPYVEKNNQMEKIELHILGCGSALPTVRHYPSSQVLSLRGKSYMFDCGEGTQLQLRRSKVKFTSLHHIFITHLHGDHCFGLMGLISTFALLGRTADLHIHAPRGLEQLLAPQLEFFCAKMAYNVVFHPFDAHCHALIYEDNSVTVHTIPLQHRMPCAGFLVKEKATLPHIRRDMIDFLQIPHYAIAGIKAGDDWTTPDGRHFENSRLVTPADPARSYAYLSDTMFVPENAPLVEGVDLLFHESTFIERDVARARQTGHSTATQAAQFAVLAKAKRLVIGHFSQRYTDNNVLLEEARSIFPSTTLANENLCITF